MAQPNIICDYESFTHFPPGQIFRVVIMSWLPVPIRRGMGLATFVCKKGHGYNDWCIYYMPYKDGLIDIELIARCGDKVMNEENIRTIFPCDDNVFVRYRY